MENDITKRQAAELLGVSLRAVNRYAAAGKLSTTYRKNAHGWTEAIFNAAELEALKKQLEAPQPIQRQEKALTLRDADKGVAVVLERLSEALETLKKRPAVPIEAQLTLSLRDAARLSGLTKGYLLKAIKKRKLKAAKRGRGWNIKRGDLKRWVAKL